MKRAMMLVLVAMLALTASAWAQTDPLLGPHNVAEKGCKACHAPHNGAVMNLGTSKSTGTIYLWGRDFKAATYNTFGGGSFTTTTTPDEADTVIHTQMCMSCHDGGISDVTMSTDSRVSNDGALSLTNDHPVHVPYENVATKNADGTVTFPSSTTQYNWHITIASGRASFVDTTWRAGHPVRLFVDETGAEAFIECSTCHNPHSYNRAVVRIGGANQVKVSSKFVRGWYEPGNGLSKSDFCRSCHLSKTDVYDGTKK